MRGKALVFAFNGIQRRAITEYKLDAEDCFILPYLKAVMLSKRTLKRFKEKEVFYYISPSKLMKELLPLRLSTRKYQRTMKKYVDAGILQKIAVVQTFKGRNIANQYYRFPKEVFKDLFAHPVRQYCRI